MYQQVLVHGTPITPISLLDQMVCESFCVSFARPDQIDQCVERQDPHGILVLDNGAFSIWQSGKGQIDREAFWRWANTFTAVCPQAVAVVPDVIGGSEHDNLLECSYALRDGYASHPERTMAIWHMDDSLDQFETFARIFNFIGIGSCAQYDVQKNRRGYLARLEEARQILDRIEYIEGSRPWVHLMRGLGQLATVEWANSADSTNVARNHNRTKGQPFHVARMAARLRRQVEITGATAAATDWS